MAEASLTYQEAATKLEIILKSLEKGDVTIRKLPVAVSDVINLTKFMHSSLKKQELGPQAGAEPIVRVESRRSAAVRFCPAPGVQRA